MTTKKNLIIRNKSKVALNEAVQPQENKENGKYIFEGVFTQCSVPGELHINKNQRIYMEDEVLPHLGYLREKIKNDGGLLGELDHPEDRVDISLKDVSHKIVDLYYDDNTHCVMGKLQLLDTPNGKIAKELVEAGMPIFVSSRAAGQADEKTHEVEIYQIFTYDIVCNPGFAEARLSRVNESKKYPNAYKYLVESKKSNANTVINENKKYGITDNAITITETNENIENMAQSYNKVDLEKPLLEDDNSAQKAQEAAEEKKKDSVGLSTPSLDPSEVSKTEENEGKKSYTSDEILNDSKEEGKEDRSEDIIDIKVNDEDTEKGDENREGDIIDIKSDVEEDTTESEEETTEGEETSTDEDSDVSECGDADVTETSDKKVNAETTKEINKQVDSNDALLKSIKKKAKVKESIVQAYPFSISLSEKNFAKFANLNKEDKMKCMNFIVEHSIYDIKSINDLWETPLVMEKKLQKNWLRLADPEDIELFKKASLEEQDAIENSAKYLILETKADVDEFWDRTGLRQRKAQEIMNEERVARYKDVVNPVDYSSDDMGYDFKVIKMAEDAMMNEF